MKVLYVGLRHDYFTGPFSVPHGVVARDLGLALGAVELGHEVEAVFWSCRDTPPAPHRGLKGILAEDAVWAMGESGFNKHPHYDAVIISGIEGARTLSACPDLRAYLAGSAIPVVAYMDAVYGELADYPESKTWRIYTCSLSGLVINRGNEWGYARWATADVPETLLDPWPNLELPRVLYAGSCDSRHREALAQLAADLAGEAQVWIVGHTTSPDDRPGLMPWGDERAPPVPSGCRLVTDAIGEQGHGRGPIPYGEILFGLMRYADVCLVMGGTQRNVSTPCKMLDYLGAGAAVVAEDCGDAIGEVLTCGAGRVVPYRDAEALALAVRGVLGGRPTPRMDVRLRVRALGMWRDVAAQMLSGVPK